MKKLNLLLAAFLLWGAVSIAAESSRGYHLLAKIPVAGDERWDTLTVDPLSRRLYLSHGTQVDVVNTDSGTVVGQIPGLSGVHGIAVAPEFNRGFISNGKTSTVTVFDLKTLAKVGEVATGMNPDVVLYDPATKSVFAFNGKSANATVIDAEKGVAVSTVELEGKPEFAVSDEQGHIFVNLEDKNSVAMIDSKNLTVAKRWPVAPGEEPSGLAIDKKNHRLFIGCGNHFMVVLNMDNGQVVSSLPIGDHADGAVFDADKGLAFSSNGDGTLTVIHQDSPDRYSVLDNVQTQPGAKTMALDPKTHKLFLPVANFGSKPEPTAEQPKPRAPIIPGTFNVLVLGQ